MSAAIEQQQQHETDPAAVVESLVMRGDLAKLTPAERLNYYRALCESLDLNPLTKPFEYITLSGKLTLYARKDATEQLRAKRRVSVQIVGRDMLQEAGVYVVTARATTPDGRADESIGVVSVQGKRGDDLANALMKAETKAKRRVTLSICGLGILDETELETIRDAQPAPAEAPRPVPVPRDPEHAAAFHAQAPAALAPLAITEDRTAEQLQADGDAPPADDAAEAMTPAQAVAVQCLRLGIDDEAFAEFLWLRYSVRSTSDLPADELGRIAARLRKQEDRGQFDQFITNRKAAREASRAEAEQTWARK